MLSLWAAPTAGAYVPSAVDQYTEQPPRGAGGPGASNDKNRSQNGGGQSDGDTGAVSIVAGGGGEGAPPAAGEGRAAPYPQGGARSEDPKPQADSTPASKTLPAGGYPTNTLLWLALLAVLAAIALRLGIAARERFSDTSAG